MNKHLFLYLHGFASSAEGTKARYFRERFETEPGREFAAIDFNPTPLDFEYMTITGQINRLRQYLLGRKWEKVSLIGSSLGALVGLHYAHRFSGVERLRLLAPVLAYRPDRCSRAERRQWEESGWLLVPHYAFGGELPLRYDFHLDGLGYLKPVPPPAPVTIIHGRSDKIVPLAFSQAYAAAFPEQVELLVVDSGHQLNDRLDFIWTQLL